MEMYTIDIIIIQSAVVTGMLYFIAGVAIYRIIRWVLDILP